MVVYSWHSLTAPPPPQGLDSGYGHGDDTYNVYDKPWREGGSTANAVYRPSKNLDKDMYGGDLEKIIKTSKSVGRLGVWRERARRGRLCVHVCDGC